MATDATPASLTRMMSLRLSLVIAAVSILVTAFFAAFLIVKDDRAQNALADHTVQYLTESLERPLWDFDTEAANALCVAFSRDNRISRLFLTGGNGERLFSYSREGAGESVTRKGSIRHNGEVVGALDLSFSAVSRRESLRDLLAFAILTNVIIVLALVLGAASVVRSQLRGPLNWLKQVVGAYSEPKASQLPGDAPVVEFRPFLDVLLGMASRIRQQVDDLQALNDALQHQARLQEMLTQIATTYINLPMEDIDSAIRVSLGEMAELVDADRTWVFEYDFQMQTATATHEWVREGVESMFSTRQRLLLAAFPEWDVDAHRQGKSLVFGSPQPLPSGNLKDLGSRSGTKSMVAVPIRDSHDCIGFVAFVWTRAVHAVSGAEERLLQVFANMLTSVRERSRTGEALRQSETSLRSVIKAAPIALWDVDHAGTIRLSEGNALAHLGLTAGQLVGQSVFDVNKDDPQALEFIRRGLAGEEFSAEVQVGGRSWRNQYVPRRDGSGNLCGLVGVSFDITESKQLEEQLLQAQKMEAIGQLAGGVAHDFNNILAATMMRLELMQDNPKLDSETRVGLRELETDAKRAAGLTRQLLMFSRRSVLEIRTLDVNEVVANMLKMVGRLLGEHIALGFEPGNGLPSVEADTGMLEQVLLNLVVNARDAMPQGGRITLATEAVEFGPEQVRPHRDWRAGQFVCLVVSDTGCGMDAATLQRIFEPFFTTKGEGTGTGLGLSTVYGILAQHKGWVEVESREGKGTTFRIYLPSSGKVAAEDAESIPEVVPAGQGTLLVVEDDTSVRQAVTRSLRTLGYRVYEAANGLEAEKMWRDHRRQIDLLLTDMVMPEGMMGLELAERLLAEKPDLKVIISSGYNTEMATAGRPSVSGIVYLAKPYRRSTLGATVGRCLGRT